MTRAHLFGTVILVVGVLVLVGAAVMVAVLRARGLRRTAVTAVPMAMTLAISLLCVGLLTALVGICALVTGLPTMNLGPGNTAVVAAFGLAFLDLCAGLAGWSLADVVHGMRGSRIVSGRVLEWQDVPGRKTTYRPLVEYVVGGSSRQVWAVPRWAKPHLGQELTVRISGRSPHEAVRTTPMAITGLLLLGGLGALGVFWTGQILSAALF